MKSKLVSLTTMALLAAGPAFGTVSLNFNAEFESGVPQNFANSLGAVSNGLIWGVLIDAGGNGLSVTPYDAIAGGPALGSNYVLSSATVATDDILYIATQTTSSTAGSIEGDSVTTGGNGGIYDLNNISLVSNGVNAGDKFYVVWFDGSLGGTLTDATFVLPADGSVLNYGVPFVGVDPTRNAGLAYVGTSGVSTGAGISFVPEPSAALLGAVGALGLLRRRRN
jgi:MYXO-CTERM domain-containing protein